MAWPMPPLLGYWLESATWSARANAQPGESGGGGASPGTCAWRPSLLCGLGGRSLRLGTAQALSLRRDGASLVRGGVGQRPGSGDAVHELQAHALELLDIQQAWAGLSERLAGGRHQAGMAGLDL